MADSLDFTALDHPAVAQFLFYPRRSWRPAPQGAADHSVPVAPGIAVSCRFYTSGREAPSILFFHGNGEVACDYDDIAQLYNRLGINLFVADYRGYGASSGTPGFSTMLSDSHPIYLYFLGVLRDSGFVQRVFIMGRSLGSAPALELAHSYQDQLQGLIIESGFASAAGLIRYLGLPVDTASLDKLEAASLAMLLSLRLPVLILHGEYDMLIPASEAMKLFEEVQARDKRLLLIPGAGHNDIMIVGIEQYFSAIRDFVTGKADNRLPPK